MSTAESSEPQRPIRPNRKRRVIVLAFVLLLLVVFLIPVGLSLTGYPTMLLNRAVGRHGFEAEVGSASLGWFSAVELSDCRVNRRDQGIRVEIPQARSASSLIGLLSSGWDFGEVTIDQPVVRLNLSTIRPGDHDSSRPGKATATWTAQIKDGSVQVYDRLDGQRLIELHSLNAKATMHSRDSVRTLTIDPLVVLDRAALTPELCDQGLQFVAPLLAKSTSLDGTASLTLNELEIPVSGQSDAQRSKRLNIAGELHLHDARAAIRSPIVSGIVHIASRLAGKPVPDSAQILEDATVRFHVHDGQVLHEGFVLVLPELSEDFQIETSGAVGFDQSLDLQVAIRIPGQSRVESVLMSHLIREPLQLRVRGTLDDPQFELSEGQSVLDEVARRLSSSDDADQKSLPGAVGSLIQGLRKDKDGKVDTGDAARGVLNVIQAIRNRDRRSGEKADKSRTDE